MLALLMAAHVCQARDVRMSRQECVEAAVSGSPTIQIADMTVRRSDFSKKETLAQLFPQIDFSLAYQRSIELQTMRMSFGGASQKIKMGLDNVWNTGFNATLPVIAPSLWKAIMISDTQILQNLESARASRLDLVNSVNKAYYALMLSVASKEVIKGNYDIAKFNADLYQKQFEQGTASEYDVLRSSVQVTNLEPELLQSDIAIKQCQLQLKVLMGIADDISIYPSQTLEEMEKEMYSSLSEGYSLEGNSSLRSLDIAAKLAKQNTDLKKFAFLPTLGASININWSSMSNGSPFKNQEFIPYSTFGVSLSLPIFSGGNRYYGVRQAQVQEKEIALQRENLVNSLNMQVDLALDNMRRESKQIESSREGVRQADKAHDIMQKSFEIGAATYLQLRDSEQAQMSASLSYFQSIYNYLVSASELEMLLGKGF